METRNALAPLPTLLISTLVLVGAFTACSGEPQASSASDVASGRTAAEWRPSTSYTLPEVSEAEAVQLRERYLDTLCDRLQPQPATTPALVRWVMPEETGATVVACLSEKGWEAKASPDGRGVTSEIPVEQRAAFDLAKFDCTARYSMDPRVLHALFEPSPELRGVIWDYYNEFLVSCLKEHGYPATEPLPSRETFVAGAAWDGYPTLPDGEVNDALASACPQQIPTSALVR